MNYQKFSHLDGDGNALAIVSTEQLWANVYALKYNKPEQQLDQSLWLSLFKQAKEAAIILGEQ